MSVSRLNPNALPIAAMNRLDLYLTHREEALLATTSRGWNIRMRPLLEDREARALDWESYAAQRTGTNGLETVAGFRHHFHSQSFYSGISYHNGRVSYFLDQASRICTISFRGSNNFANWVNDATLTSIPIKPLAEPIEFERRALHRMQTSAVRLSQTQIQDEIRRAQLEDDRSSTSALIELRRIFTASGFTSEAISSLGRILANSLNTAIEAFTASMILTWTQQPITPELVLLIKTAVIIQEELRRHNIVVTHAEFLSLLNRISYTPVELAQTENLQFLTTLRIVRDAFQNRFSPTQQHDIDALFERIEKVELLEKYHKFEIHSGFAREYRALRADIYNRLKPGPERFGDLNGDWRFLITGHSLGGALATLCTADLLLNQILPANRIALITLGSPRAGNYDFARWIDSQGLFMNTRIEYDRDLVITLPAQCNGAYWHRGRLTHLQNQLRTVAPIYGEQNGVFRTIGNLASGTVGLATDIVSPTLTRALTSGAGFILDAGFSIIPFGWEALSTRQIRIPLYDPAIDHGRAYWRYQPYARNAHELRVHA
jgi:hypothetical protein